MQYIRAGDVQRVVVPRIDRHARRIEDCFWLPQSTVRQRDRGGANALRLGSTAAVAVPPCRSDQSTAGTAINARV